MRCLLVCLLCLQGLQSILCAAAREDVDLLQDLRGALASSLPRKSPPRTRHVSATDPNEDTWPKGVLIGAGLSAFQAEGAWDEDGKGESSMDWIEHLLGDKLFPNNTDVAADHYHRFREDLDLAKKLKFTSHRFSISWSRVLPTGGVDNINQKGVQFYKDYIDKVIENGMEPMVTMLHFDQPIAVENATGGWGYPAMVDKYVEYADFLFETFGDKVKYWNTINEPNMYCNYFGQIMNSIDMGQKGQMDLYPCLHHIVLAHMKTYHLYRKKYQSKQKGKVGTSVVMWPATPKTTQSEDVMAAETFNQMYCGTILHPLVFGDYPPIVRYLVEKRDAEMGVSEPRLPKFTAEEKEMLSGGVTDFIALNLYSGCKASYRHNKTVPADSAIFPGPVASDMPFVELSGIGEFGQVDESFMHNGLTWVWNTYHVPIIISENGYGDSNQAGVHDTVRAAYHSANLRSLVRTMKEYDVEVLAYYAWSLLDLFEFRRPFGLIHVDYQTGSLNRTLKDSAQFFIDLATTGKIPYVEVSAGSSLTPIGKLLLVVWVAKWLGL
ncbi:myrosinase 1-like isoform X2 [Frankliniella occidentalis]|uniref:Myrosinase 1-like isoform X2 n=1 Tax=Frankliniella occidentalis TaxID=133901 RepID=A0A9C6TSW8_FRAOC|nr:myrosinase 1-like isoform X2 [Frankliniella occidentalis]